MSLLDAHKQAEIDSRTPEFIAAESTKPFGWEPYHWVCWATIAQAMRRLAIARGSDVLDLGSGAGWTSLFLAETGHRVTAVDLVPANVELISQRAARWGASIDARVADMEQLDLDRRFDFVLIHDALHHCTRHRRVLEGAAAHLRPGGWVLVGEPGWLHRLSPAARRQSRATGWVERGFTTCGLRRDLRAAGFEQVTRLLQPTDPTDGRLRDLVWQLTRLTAARFAAAPQMLIWLAARRPGAA